MGQKHPKTVSAFRWLNRTVLGVGLASFLSDWSHEMATAVLPAFLASFGASAAWLGIIEGISDGLSSFAKMASGYFTDQMRRRKPVAVAGYLVSGMAIAAIGGATRVWQVLVCRATAWLGRGFRTPVRKALLADAVSPDTYGRAFGFERMMDTVGAVIGPLTATGLLVWFNHNYERVFLFTLLPGLLAAVAMALVVKEKERKPVPHVALGERLSRLPVSFRRFLLAVGIFGAGDFAHSMLILLAAQSLAGSYGPAVAVTLAVSLYLLHNVVYAAFAMVTGWLGDHFDKRRLLAATYGLAACTGLLLVLAPKTLPLLTLIFVLAGVFVAAEEALEDSLAAELVPHEQHGMGFGLLATVNGVGDLISSAIVGMVWNLTRPELAFSYSTILFTLGAMLVWSIRKPSQA